MYQQNFFLNSNISIIINEKPTESTASNSTKLNDILVVNLALCSDVQVKKEVDKVPDTPQSLNLHRVSWFSNIDGVLICVISFRLVCKHMCVLLFTMRAARNVNKTVCCSTFDYLFCIFMSVEYKSTEFVWTKEAMDIVGIDRCQSRRSKTVYGYFKNDKWGNLSFILSRSLCYASPIKKNNLPNWNCRFHGTVQILLCFPMSQ